MKVNQKFESCAKSEQVTGRLLTDWAFPRILSNLFADASTYSTYSNQNTNIAFAATFR